MDDQKFNQFLNEQSLINLSVIEQLNQQAGYLNSIVERLELISEALSLSEPYDQRINQRLKGFDDERKLPHSGIDTSRAKGMVIGGMEDLKPKETKEAAMTSEGEEKVVAPAQTVVTEPPLTDEEQAERSIEEMRIDIERSLLFGDHIQVITPTASHTGIFLELDGRHIVWVIDEGRLSFTDLGGATIIKLT